MQKELIDKNIIQEILDDILDNTNNIEICEIYSESIGYINNKNIAYIIYLSKRKIRIVKWKFVFFLKTIATIDSSMANRAGCGIQYNEIMSKVLDKSIEFTQNRQRIEENKKLEKIRKEYRNV